MKYVKVIAVFSAVFLAACSQIESSGGSLAAQNLADSKAWLQENLKNQGVVNTPSGLQYKIVSSTNGGGCKPERSSTIRVNYDMRLAKTGYEFDSSFKRGAPSEFPLSQMIDAWGLGIPMMAIGDSWEFYIPPKLAYGSKGSGGLIQPNVVLISRVDLLGSSNCR